MRIVVAPDSFKECLSAVEVCRAIEAGIREAWPEAEVTSCPMADGGEGTVDALVMATRGGYIETPVDGPLGEGVTARYGILGDGETAVIEMAAASGLPLIPPAQRNPLITTTYGAGQLIRDAIERGLSRIIIGIGGSATNDGGAGMAQALGFSLRDASDREIDRGGAALLNLDRIETANAFTALTGVDVLVACDVQNPLTGPEGTTRVYAKQKGADPAAIELLDAALERYGRIVERDLGVRVLGVPGVGAAGGLGAGLLAFAGATLRPGIEIVAEACGLDDAIQNADLVITGEGRIDAQSAYGKVPAGVARIAKRLEVPVVALCGELVSGFESLYANGIDAVIPIGAGPATLEESIRRAPEDLRRTAASLARILVTTGTVSRASGV